MECYRTHSQSSKDSCLTDRPGFFFDFLPTKDEKSIFLFILYEKKWIPSEALEKQDYDRIATVKNEKKRYQRNVIKVWLCKEVLRSPDTLQQLIETDMNEPFYVFQRNSDYFFTTISGKIYVAPLIAVDSKRIERLIAELDSETFAIREKATQDLRSLGKPTQAALDAQLSKSTSMEQKRRIARLLDELKPLPDRETKLLWNDGKRPVDKLLFDLDNKKTYAFTKPNPDKQIYFFEVTDKPQPQLFTGNANPDEPASVPASTRLFLEYARFVKKSK